MYSRIGVEYLGKFINKKEVKQMDWAKRLASTDEKLGKNTMEVLKDYTSPSLLTQVRRGEESVAVKPADENAYRVSATENGILKKKYEK